MSSGMNLEEANEYAETMSYRKAINNIRYAKGIAYKKATWIKLRELAGIADTLVHCGECKYEPICSHSVQHTTHEPTTVTIGYKSVDYCSYGERKGE